MEYNRYLNVVGIGVVIGIAALLSKHRSKIDYRLIVNALTMQIVIAYLALKTDSGERVLAACSRGVSYLYLYAEEGVKFLFGNLANNVDTPWGTVFAVKILPLIVFFGAFMALMFHIGLVQSVVNFVGRFVRPMLGTSGAETTCAIANSFLGQTESPLLIRNYLKDMTRSELLVVMVSGMGTISGSILVVFASMGAPVKSLLTASVMAIPATIMIAKILLPETEKRDGDATTVVHKPTSANVFDALSTGTSDGLGLALNVGAMLIAFIALMSMVNGILSGTSVYINELFSTDFPILTIDYIFSKLFYPFAWLLGFTGDEAVSVAELLGTKVGVNEFLAYYKLVGMHLSERTAAVVSFALCGFSNFSCIGIQVGGIGILVPEKRVWLTELGITAVLGGALSNLLTAMIAGLFL
jgi:CNT family concentrative nucleoside transporter